jgi:phosphotransferase system enzyme I (PtsI)
MKTIEGISASAGIAIGKIFLYRKSSESGELISGLNDLSIEEAKQKFNSGVKDAIGHLEKIRDDVEQNIGYEEAGIFDAQILMLEDEDFQTAVIDEIIKGTKLVDAIWVVIDYFVAKFELMKNSYFQERAADIRDVGNQLLNALVGNKVSRLNELSEEVIIVAHEISPSETAEMRKEMVLGFATDLGGSSSHVAIIARALNIPAVVGSSIISESVEQGDTLILDGVNGKIIINPSIKIVETYRKQKKQIIAEQLALKKLAHIRAETSDGKKISIQANIGSLDEVEIALENGAEGIGLFRTEFLFLGKETVPEEDFQYRVYKKILESMEDKPVIIRILDVGGDKEIPSIRMVKEANPFLGLRGSRFISNVKLRSIIVDQLRAALKASSFGKLKLMFPMVSTVDEIVDLKSMVNECKIQIEKEGFRISDSLEVGVMVEVPSIAICIEKFSPHVDFFSIGTNDLTQYVLASDRTNKAVANIYDQFHPAVLKLIQQVVISAHSFGKWVGVCGELASEVLAIPVLIGMGVDELSMSVNMIPFIKKKVTELSSGECHNIAETVLNLATANQVRDFLKNGNTH